MKKNQVFEMQKPTKENDKR